MPQIELNRVNKTYQVGTQLIVASKDVTLSIERGDLLSIVGHSGSGKTTLLSMIGGMLKPASGTIQYDGRDIYSFTSDNLSEYRCDRIGFMFQFASLLPNLTVRENLVLPTVFREGRPMRSGGTVEEKAIRLLQMVGLPDKVDAYPAQLSGGQQRRIAIARAFMNDPELILADEPTGDLDEETEMDMVNFFLTMNRAERITFILVTHNSDLAKRAARRFRMTRGVLEDLA